MKEEGKVTECVEHLYTIVCLDCEDDVPDLCHNIPTERVGKLGKRFSTCVDHHHLNSIVDCEGNDCSLVHQSDSDFERLLDDDENLEDNDILLLTESDIPGASLDGKHPSELSVVQLKRWLVCRGAPVTGKKPELIQRYAGSFMS